MLKSTFSVPKMDCPSEESMIRTKLDIFQEIHSLSVNLQDRSIAVFHTGELKKIEKSLSELGLGAKLTETVEETEPVSNQDGMQKTSLYIVLVINLTFFISEVIAGLLSGSMGLIADSLDMLADAIVYGLSIYAIGKMASKKKSIARISGWFQILLAMIGFSEVIRRFIGVEGMPDFRTMIIVSSLAMIANISCLFVLLKNRSREAHMRASMIFTSNDVIINAGVILAGILVVLLKSNKPDLIVGAIVFLVVISGAFRILKLAK